MNRRIAVLIACFFTVLISYCIRYGYGVLLPDMLSSLEISKTEAGLIYAFFFIAYTIFSPLLGTLGDRYSLRFIIVIFVIVLGVGTLLMAFAFSLMQAILFFTLVGIGSAACWAPVMALAQRWTRDQHRGKTLAFVDIGSALGIIVSSTGLPLAVHNWDWRMGWLILGIAGLAIAAMDFAALRDPPGKPIGNKSTGSAWKPGALYAGLFVNGKFWLLGLAYLFTGFAIIIPFTFLTTFASQELDFTCIGEVK
ncbi:MAG: MFS transporter, partial [Dehalococcoidales bacterium]|nr:MFS transporter [Dehalococcoidales bacterium]